MKVTYSAPAKIILSGEHAVVYGKPAIVSAINKRLTFTVEDGKQKPDGNVDFIAEIVKEYLTASSKDFKDKPYKTSVSSDIPRKRGMGSSAAYSVASVAAFLEFFTGSKKYSPETINNLAYKAEKHFHKNPSGVDQTASCFGGLVYFRKEFEFLKGIYKLSYKLPKSISDNLFIVDTGKPTETTAKMVSLVGKSYNENPQRLDSIFSRIEKTTKRMTVAIVKEDKKFFGDQLKENGKLLSKLGIVSEHTKNLVSGLMRFGTGKITGAGGAQEGSGFMLFLANDAQEFENYCKKKKISFFKFEQSHKGVERIS